MAQPLLRNYLLKPESFDRLFLFAEPLKPEVPVNDEPKRQLRCTDPNGEVAGIAFISSAICVALASLSPPSNVSIVDTKVDDQSTFRSTLLGVGLKKRTITVREIETVNIPKACARAAVIRRFTG